MADLRKPPPVILVRRPRPAEAPHSHGTWKIAYADFVTAMMAFFLLLWLVSSTDEEKRKGLSEFFNAIPISGAGGNGLLEGEVIDISRQQAARPPASGDPFDTLSAPGADGAPESTASGWPEAADAGSTVRAADRAAFAEIETALEAALRATPELAGNLKVERTEEGLRIQIIDQERSPMFASGSAALAPRTQLLLRAVAAAIRAAPNRIAIAGHTDAHPLARGDYTNWELSADRANAARRVLVAAQVPDERVARVQGMAERQPLIESDPGAAGNRRISVMLLWQDS
jgi:chemotaxis protein MotB